MAVPAHPLLRIAVPLWALSAAAAGAGWLHSGALGAAVGGGLGTLVGSVAGGLALWRRFGEGAPPVLPGQRRRPRRDEEMRSLLR